MKMVPSADLEASHLPARKLAGALGRPRGMVWGGRTEEGSGWGTRVYLWRIHVDIWQNQYNIVKLKKKKNSSRTLKREATFKMKTWWGFHAVLAEPFYSERRQQRIHRPRRSRSVTEACEKARGAAG